MQLERGEMEVVGWVEVQVGVGILGLQVNLHYEELVWPEGNQRLFLLMGWAGPRQEVE